MAKMTVTVDADLHRKIRIMCLDLGISFQKLAVRALEEFLRRHKGERRAKR